MKKMFLIGLVVLALTGCGNETEAVQEEWPSVLHETILTENIIEETILYEDVIVEDVIGWDDFE